MLFSVTFNTRTAFLFLFKGQFLQPTNSTESRLAPHATHASHAHTANHRMASSNSLFGEYETKVKYISASWLGSPQRLPAYESYASPSPPVSCPIQHLTPLCPRRCATASRSVYSVQHAWGPCSDSSEWGNVATVPHLNTHPSTAHPHPRVGTPCCRITCIHTLLHVHMFIYLALGSIGLTRISLANQHLINLTNAAKHFETRWARCCCSCSSRYTRYPRGRRVLKLCANSLFARMKA